MDYRSYTLFNMNIFRLTGDMCHVFAMFVMLFQIIRTKSCKGVSGRTQILFATVFITRYLDLFTEYLSAYNTTMKITYIACTLSTVFLIYALYRDSYDRANDIYRVEFLVIFAFILALIYNHQFEMRVGGLVVVAAPCCYPIKRPIVKMQEIAWTFSIYLEALAIIPQLYLTRKRGCSRHMALYLVALGLYRMFYILNWIFRYLAENHVDEISFCAGTVQTFILFTFICWGSNDYHQLEKIDEENVPESKKPSPLDFTLDANNRNMLFNYIQQKHSKEESAESADADNKLVKVHNNHITAPK